MSGKISIMFKSEFPLAELYFVKFFFLLLLLLLAFPKKISAEEIIIPGTTIKKVILSSQLEEGFGEDYRTGNSIQWIPHLDLPDKKLMLNYLEMFHGGYFNKIFGLKRDQRPWSAGFFSAWHGGIAGEWQRSRLSNVLKTIFGGEDFNEKSALQSVFNSLAEGNMESLNIASAAEKYDVLVGDYNYTAIRIESALRGRKSGESTYPRTWAGYCNGVSAAGLLHAEPFRRVDVINREGVHFSFYPNDIKALLAMSYFNVDGYARVGNRCEKSMEIDLTKRIDDPDCRDVNPGSLLIALVNRLGRAGTSFIIDKNRFKSVSNHPVSRAKINLVHTPYLIHPEEYKYAAQGTKYLMDVIIELEIGSTTEKDYNANIEEPRGNGFYQKVGFIPEVITYRATIELDAKMNIIGGEWTGKKHEAPDFIWFGSMPAMLNAAKYQEVYELQGEPLVKKVLELDKAKCEVGEMCDALKANPGFQWSIIKVIYDMSISDKPEVPLLDLRLAPFQVDHPERKIVLPVNEGGEQFTVTLLHSKINSELNIAGYINAESAVHPTVIKLFGLRPEKEPKEIDSTEVKEGEQGHGYFLLKRGSSISKYEGFVLKFFKEDARDKLIEIGKLSLPIVQN